MKIYVTVPKKQREYQLTFTQLLSDNIFNYMRKPLKDTKDTVTYFIDEEKCKKELIEKFNIDSVINDLEEFYNKYKPFFDEEDRNKLYYSFRIPKKSKPNPKCKEDMREINAPDKIFCLALRELKELFEKDFLIKYHTSCFAYVPKRDNKKCLERHQSNQSKWFLKLDLKNFFPNTTEEFIINQISTIFPYNLVMKDERGKFLLQKCINLCMLNGGLPQGTPISPMLTNIVMLPIDYTISKVLRTKYKNFRFVYTRYADDISVSSPYKFEYKEIENEIKKIFKEFSAPFSLNSEKTRFGSYCGRNWNLGLMYNKDGNITVGHQRKKELKAALNSFVLDYINKGAFDFNGTQKLRGQISYVNQIEPDYVAKLINFYNKKYQCDVYGIFKQILSGQVIMDSQVIQCE